MFDRTLVETKKLYDVWPICGKEKSIKNITCSRECAAKKSNKVDWGGYNLKKLYNDIGSYSGVATHIGNISDVAVKKRMKKEGLI